ncbi:MAG: thiamine-phosphate kinase [Nitrososphaerales archaeon]
MKRPSEREIIDLIHSVLGISMKRTIQNDDVATFPLGKNLLVLKCDMLVQGTDVPEQMEPWQIARKSIVSCLSDLSCKGVRPAATLLSLAIPRRFTESDVAGLARGFRIAEKEFGVNIIGGDTNEGRELVIDCCMVGIAKQPMIVRRSGAKKRDLIVTSGPFGYSAAGLRILTGKSRSAPSFRKKAVGVVLMPEPRLKFGYALSRYATSAMDSSDGLAITLYELSRASRKRFVLDRLPTTQEVRKFAKENGYDLEDLVLYGGEEYEIVATVPARHLERLRRLARAAGCTLFAIGSVEDGTGVYAKEGEKKRRIEKRGWEHLAAG